MGEVCARVTATAGKARPEKFARVGTPGTQPVISAPSPGSAQLSQPWQDSPSVSPVSPPPEPDRDARRPFRTLNHFLTYLL